MKANVHVYTRRHDQSHNELLKEKNNLIFVESWLLEENNQT